MVSLKKTKLLRSFQKDCTVHILEIITDRKDRKTPFEIIRNLIKNPTFTFEQILKQRKP